MSSIALATEEALAKYGGADRIRTGDLVNATHALCQLSYSPYRLIQQQDLTLKEDLILKNIKEHFIRITALNAVQNLILTEKWPAIRPVCHSLGDGESFSGGAKYGGADRIRTGDLMDAIHALCQLSYNPTNDLYYIW